MNLITKLIGLISFLIFSPIILFSALIVFLHDFKNPFYLHKRVGLNGYYFTLYKIRSMRINSGLKNYTTTSVNDQRLFWFGKFLRKYKIDEFPQFLNLFFGDMNVIGPRPNIIELVKEYSNSEFSLLDVKPGITDISSVILSDLNSLVSTAKNPDLYYKKNIRPKKFKMSKFYINNRSLSLDVIIFFCTIIGIINSNLAKKYLRNHILKKYNHEF